MIRRSFLRQLVVALLVFFVQETFALRCEGTVYIQVPPAWGQVFLWNNGRFLETDRGITDKWIEYTFVADHYGSSFSLSESTTLGYSRWVSKKGYNISDMPSSNNDEFTCDDLASGSLYIYEDPANPGRTAYGSNPPNAKYLFVMIPSEYEEWMTSVPMISMDGGKTGKPMKVESDKCGWYSYVWFNESVSDEVLLYRDDDDEREDMIGFKGNWETASTPTLIPMNMLFEAMGVDTLYFVPDENLFLSSLDNGWYTEFPEGIEGSCGYDLAAIIYDTDAALHPAFSCYSEGVVEGCQFGTQGISAGVAQAYVDACIGVTPGLVKQYLDPSVPQKKRKPKMSANGAKCFINDNFFDQLFNYTPGVNEKSCYNMPFTRSGDGKWEFDSDYYRSVGTTVPGGFYPVETTSDVSILGADPAQTPIPKARVKRAADGPVFYGPALRELHPTENEPLIDVFCNGAGWDGGYNCEGHFASGDELAEYVQSKLKSSSSSMSICVLGWSCSENAPSGWTFFKSGTEIIVSQSSGSSSMGEPRWRGMRNQHFCFESHAKFVFKPGLTFNFRGDDDIWVYIDNTLAVDLGGTHLAAPAYVKLDNFAGYGGRPLEVGTQYDIDIYFCDRRTTMSNVRIKTNMYLQQRVGVEMSPVTDPNSGAKTYNMCYTKSGDGGCASAVLNDEEEIRCCGDEIITKCGAVVSYYLVKGMVFNRDGAMALTPGMINKGGIDLTDISAPKIDKKKVIVPPGVWSLFAEIEGSHKRIRTFRSQSTPDVMYRTPKGVLDSNGMAVKGFEIEYTGSGLAGELLPVYITFLYPDNESPEYGPLYISPSEAVGLPYTLETDGLTLYGFSGGKFKRVDPSESRTVGPSGVDTLYVMVDPSALKGEKSKIYYLKAKGSVSVPAYFTFFLDVKDLNAALEAEKDSSNTSGEGSDKPKSSSSAGKPSSSNSNGHGAKPSFHIEMTGPFTFEIVMDGEKPAKQAYVVTDLAGNVVKQGELGGDETRIALKNSGYYIVKIGHKYQVVKFR